MSENGTSMDRRRFLSGAGGILVLYASGGIMAGCSGRDSTSQSTSGATPQSGGSATLSFRAYPVNMDPADGQLYSSMQIYQNIFSDLLSVDANYKYQPNLASAWEQEDPKTWRFELVDNAVFHNDEPVTAEDVAFTIKRIKSHPLGILFREFKDVEVLKKHSFRLHLNRPYGPLEATLSYLLGIVNEKAVTENNPKRAPIGCGPYRMADWAQGSHVSLKKWNKYFKSDRPYLDEIRTESQKSSSTALTTLQSGDVDWIEKVPPQRAETLMSDTSISHTKEGSYFPWMLNLNNARAPFNDKRVRQAVCWAIDRKVIVDSVMFGTATASSEPITDAHPWYSGVSPYDGGPNLEKARSLMAQAGITEVDVEYISETEVPVQSAIGQVLKSQLKKIGINVIIKKYASSRWIGLRANHKFDMSASYFSVGVDPGQTYYLECHSSSPFNRSASKSEAVDNLAERIMYEADQQKREQVYPDLVRAAADDASVLFLFMDTLQYWMDPMVHGPRPLPSLQVKFEEMWRG